MTQTAELDHLVWIRETTWRVLTCHATEQEARDAVKHHKANGDKARYARRGDATDVKLRANVWQQ